MKYLDANILFPMFATSKKRHLRYIETGTSGNTIIDYCFKLIKELDNNRLVLIVSDLAVLESLGVASRDAGPGKAKIILQAINKQLGIVIIQTTQLAWVLAKTITIVSSIEGRDSLHLANSLLTKVVTELVTCDKNFALKSRLFLEGKIHDFAIPRELLNWYRLSQDDAQDLYRLVQSCPNLEIELLEPNN
ncbi:MAG: hypothetical protein ACTSP4_01480 [Candidatus Hodarchaeales archaeon]